MRENDLGFVYDAPFDVILSGENVVQPDIMFISKEHSNIITEDNIRGAPDLIIEIVSSSTSKRDKEIKNKIYSKYGVKEYWIVNPIIRSIEIRLLLQKGKLETIRTYGKDEILNSQVLQNLRLDLNDVF